MGRKPCRRETCQPSNKERKGIVCPIAQLVEHGSIDPKPVVRARFESHPRALTVYSRLGWPAAGGSGRAEGQLTSVSRGGPCPAMGYVKLSLLNSADYPEFPDRTVGVRTCATSYA